MPTYMLLLFDDDNSAYQFAATAVHDDAIGMSPFRLWGIFRKPTSFCECASDRSATGASGSRGRSTGLSFTRGRSFGWWVHSVCMRPTARGASGAQWFSVLGANLLPRVLRPYPEEMPVNLESPAVWTPLLDVLKSAQED